MHYVPRGTHELGLHAERGGRVPDHFRASRVHCVTAVLGRQVVRLQQLKDHRGALALDAESSGVVGKQLTCMGGDYMPMGVNKCGSGGRRGE